MTQRKLQGIINRARSVFIEIEMFGEMEWVRAKKYSAKRAVRLLRRKGVTDFSDHVYLGQGFVVITP